MAYFYMNITSVSRGAGRSATAAAAYRAGERIRDERTGRVHNHGQRRDVTHTEIFVPEQFTGQPLEWARNRQQLWNAADHAEKRHNARVAREYQVTLPSELNAAQRLSLARAFSREIAERYGVAVDLAVHEPRPGGDPRNFHAHLLTTTRAVTPAGLGAKSGLDMQALDRYRRGLPSHKAEYVNVRERYAQLTNSALREAGIEASVDHRSLAAQGIDREPRPRIPEVHFRMERRGIRSEIAEELRTQYQERIQLRRTRARQPGAAQAAETAAESGTAGRGTLKGAMVSIDLEEVRRQARESWLALRAAARAEPVAGQGQEVGPAPRQAEDELAR
jgi:ATP-dependent exoDNAse (exonuclease V) alpha subunit